MDIKKVDARMADDAQGADEVRWITIKPTDTGGLLWARENQTFSRLEENRPWRENLRLLSANTSGVYLLFETDSPLLRIHARVGSAAYMSHMTAVATIGFDLYVLADGAYRPVAVTKVNRAEYTTDLLSGLPRAKRRCLLYFPLYISLSSLELGVSPVASFDFLARPKRPKAVFYGTSILQGGCASRAGMSMTNIFMRRHPELDVYNLGFSGNAHCDLELARALAGLPDVSLLVLELEMNNGQALKERLEPFLEILRPALAHARVILYSRFPQALSLLSPELRADTVDLRDYQRATLARLWPSARFVDGEVALASIAYEGAVDGVHLTDLGFLTWEDSLEHELESMKGDRS